MMMVRSVVGRGVKVVVNRGIIYRKDAMSAKGAQIDGDEYE
ncbi:MAG: hypothetical protein ABIY71_04125 [Flavobacteriales bacterium]